MATNTATVKMIRNIIDGTTPIQSRALLNAAFPVGTILYRTDAVSPASIYGGSWERIVDKFLYSAGGTTIGSTGGEAAHTLTVNEMPSHMHRSKSANVSGKEATSSYNEGTAGRFLGGSAYGYYITDVDSETRGGSQPHNNMPPYLAVTAWKRIE